MHENSVTLVVLTCCLIEGVLSIIFNGLLVLVFLRNPLKNIWQRSSILIFNVTLSDFLAGLILVYWSTAHWHFHWGQDWSNTATKQALWMCALTSVITLVVLSFERFLVVKRPWDAPQMITRRRTILVCVISWLFSLVLCSTLRHNAPVFILVSSVLIEGFVAIQILCYLLVWRHMMCKESMSPSYDSEERQLTFVVFILVLILIVTALPVLICYQLLLHCVFINKLPAAEERLGWLVFYLNPLYCVNFVLNPIIYAWRLRKYRNSFMALFRRKPEQLSNSPSLRQLKISDQKQHLASPGENLNP